MYFCVETIWVIDFTWAPCDVFTQQIVQWAAEKLAGSPAAFLRHLLHHLHDFVHAGGSAAHHLEERSKRRSALASVCVCQGAIIWVVLLGLSFSVQ